MIEKHRNYTIRELKELFGPNWREALGIPYQPVIQNKPIINFFEEFDDETKEIYLTIYNLIKSKNINRNINVWATGSRVKGTWKTKEEAEEYAVTYKCRVKYSDYDYHTDALVRPTKQEFEEILNVSVDQAGGEGHKVLITV